MTFHEAELIAKGLHIGIVDLFESAVNLKSVPI